MIFTHIFGKTFLPKLCILRKTIPGAPKLDALWTETFVIVRFVQPSKSEESVLNVMGSNRNSIKLELEPTYT